MNATLSRLLLLVHGQDDALDNPPKRFLIPGSVDADGTPTPNCAGAGCNQGRTPERCDCVLDRDDTEFRWRDARHGYVLHPDLHRVTLTELDLEVPHDPVRTFSGMTAAEKRAAREHKTSRAIGAAQALAAVVASGAVMAFVMLVMRGAS